MEQHLCRHLVWRSAPGRGDLGGNLSASFAEGPYSFSVILSRRKNGAALHRTLEKRSTESKDLRWVAMYKNGGHVNLRATIEKSFFRQAHIYVYLDEVCISCVCIVLVQSLSFTRLDRRRTAPMTRWGSCSKIYSVTARSAIPNVSAMKLKYRSSSLLTANLSSP